MGKLLKMMILECTISEAPGTPGKIREERFSKWRLWRCVVDCSDYGVVFVLMNTQKLWLTAHNIYKNLYVDWELTEWVKVPAIMPSTKGCILRTLMDKGKKRLLQVFFRTASMRREWATLDSTKIPFRTYN